MVCEQWFSPGAKSQWLLTRIEVNANMSRDALETNDQTVTTVRDETGISIDIDALIVETAEDFIQLLSHAGSNGALCHGVLRAIESRLAWIDEPVAVATGGWQVCGLVHGLDESGRLQIRTADGIHLLASGDLKQLHSADRLGVWQGFPQGPAERHTFARD